MSHPSRLPKDAHPPELKAVWFDRDLAWLEFNRRVLHEALDERTPLLERLKFLAIFTSNLDEFFMKRVGAMRTRAYRAPQPQAIEGFSRHIKSLRAVLLPMLAQQAECFAVVRSRLVQHGIRLATWEELSATQREEASAYFDAHVSPALTPLSLDPSHPFPFLSNLSTSWGLILRHPDTQERMPVRVKVPSNLPQWLPLHTGVAEGELCFLGLHELVRQNAHKLFPGMEIEHGTLFRVARNAEVALDEDGEHDLPELIEEQLRQRRFEPVVRLEFAFGYLPIIRQGLIERFGLSEDDVYDLPGLLDYTGLFQIAALDRPELRDPPWTPLVPKELDEDADLFAAIRTRDILVHHPYESFDATVERFIREAADDPRTVAIKMTVYRVGDDTPFVHSLIRAAEAGKQVACLVELKARFDEARNLHWANELRAAGAHVVYGVMGLKTHTKLALVVRKEGEGLQSYAHIATGNYHVKTARLYSDLGLLTCNPTLTADVVRLFHHLTGYSRRPEFAKLLVAPFNMRDRFIAMIRREIEQQRAGRPARIIAKINQLEDPPVCEALVEASQAGVRIDLIVRGFCCLRPGIPGATEQIRVRSIIGRFLEHSRIFYFANGCDDPLEGEFYIGSADWMDRNLSRRIEAVTPIEPRELRQRLWEILTIALADCRQAWEMQPDGSYRQLTPPEGASGPALLGTHAALMELTRKNCEAPSL